MRYGTAFSLIGTAAWRRLWEGRDIRRTELQRIQKIIDTLAAGQPGTYLYISRLEQLILGELLTWAERRSCQATPPAIAAACGVAPQSVSRVLRRLGRSQIILNRGTPRRQNLAVDPRDERWNFATLRDLRNAESGAAEARFSAAKDRLRNLKCGICASSGHD